MNIFDTSTGGVRATLCVGWAVTIEQSGNDPRVIIKIVLYIIAFL